MPADVNSPPVREERQEGKEVKVTGRLLQHLEKFVQNQKLLNAKVCITEGSNLGDNYMGVIYRATIHGTRNGEPLTIRAIGKCVPGEGSAVKITGLSRVMFLREIYFYQQVLPIFRQILLEYGIRPEYFPELYVASEEEGDETLILEDLKCEGFTMNSSKMLDYEHLSLTIRCLGQFHAYSFVGRMKHPELFEKLKCLTEPLFHSSANGAFNIDQGKYINTKALCDVVAEALKDEDTHYSERYRRFADNFDKHMIEVTDGSKAEPYAVVIHGDVWTNNMLFKYQSEREDSTGRGKPEALRFLDFQLCRYASPVLDIVYLLYCCCTTRTRQENYDRLLREYHNSLTEFLTRCNCDVELLFPWDVFLQHLRQFGKFAGGMAIYVMHLFTSVKGEPANFEPVKLRARLQSDSLYRNTLRDIFKELIDRDYV